ncbi:MAG: beta-galactosidase [Armatimonadetes bacterium]|nr:beta-galactosidase [Armatimonadota bacterium]
MLIVLCVAAAAVGQPVSYVVNGRCEGLTGWELPAGTSGLAPRDGGQCIFFTAGSGQQAIWRRPDWKRMTVAVEMRADEVVQDQPGGFAYAAVYQYDENETLIAFRDFAVLRQPAGWQQYGYTFDVQPETATIYLRFGFYNAHGKAYFDNWTLVEGEQVASIESVRELPSRVGSDKVVIWREPNMELPAGGLSPTWAASVLRSAGIPVTLADRSELAHALDDGAGGVLILPYGPAYPVELRASLIGFLRNAGKLLVVGGYPFHMPLGPDGTDWAAELKRQRAEAEKWPSNALPDGGFENTQEGPPGTADLSGHWRRNNAEACRIVSEGALEGSHCALVRVDGQPEGEAMWHCYLPTRPGHDYLFRAWVRTEKVSGPAYAYVAVYQYAGDRLVRARDVIQLTGNNDWREVEYRFSTEYGVDRLLVKVGLYRAVGSAWFDKIQLVDLTPFRYRPLNTSSAPPGDGLHCAPYQMGMCDAHFPLKRVAFLQPAAEQYLITRERSAAPAQGWACVGVVGYSNARWVPLLDAKDRYDRLRGAAGAMMVHYGGFYQGSLWAYFGVTDRPLFGSDVPGSDEELIELVRFLTRGVFVHSLRTNYDLYQQGETCRVQFAVANYGPKEFRGQATVALIGERDYERAAVPVVAPAGQSSFFEASLTIPRCTEDILQVIVYLEEDGRRIDQMRRGVVVQRKELSRNAPLLDWADNYFRLEGRPVFLFGSDNYSNDYKSEALNPGRWDEIQSQARDLGVQVYENLQYNNPGHVMTETDWRSFEAMGQLLQKRGLVFMCGLLIGHNVAVNDEELAQESRLCAEYARHLGFMPGLLWYINGDYQLRYEDTEFLQRAWRDWLKARYGSDEALRKAWGISDLPPIVELPFPPRSTGRWDDPAEQDRVRFNVWLMERWNKAHVSALRSVDRRHKITSEYYSEPWAGIDQRLTIDGQDVSNFGFFSTPEDDLDVLPERLAINDLRAIGKGVSTGEYGCKTHPAWTVENGTSGYHIVRSEEQQKQLFMAAAAYALGMGASKIQNWCLRDADENVFPWGIFYPGRNVPKDVAYVHRNLSIMWRILEPQYEAPTTTILVPTPLRLGAYDSAGRNAVYGAAQALLRLHISFNVLDDFDVYRIPRQTTTLIWPAAVAASDEVFDAVMQWVKSGGQLVVTGYPGWDENRRQVGDRRLKNLTGCGVSQLHFPGISRGAGPERTVTLHGTTVSVRPQVMLAGSPSGRILAKTADGAAVMVGCQIGRGAAVWIADPAELGGPDNYEALTLLYRAAIQALPNPPAQITVVPDDPQVHVMKQRTRTGHVWVVFPTPRQGPDRYTLTVPTPAGDVALQVRRRWPAAVMVSNAGRVLMLLADGFATVGGKQVSRGTAMAGLMSLDGQDLRRSAAVLVLPFSTGDVTLPTFAGSAELGEWRDGRWHVLEDLYEGTTGPVSLKFDEDRATGVVLLCGSNGKARWRERLEDLCRRPWSLPGY